VVAGIKGQFCGTVVIATIARRVRAEMRGLVKAAPTLVAGDRSRNIRLSLAPDYSGA